MKKFYKVAAAILTAIAIITSGSTAQASITNGNQKASDGDGKVYAFNPKKDVGKKNVAKIKSVSVKVTFDEASADTAAAMLVDEESTGIGYCRDYILDTFKTLIPNCTVKSFKGNKITLKMEVDFTAHAYIVMTGQGSNGKVSNVKYYNAKGKVIKKKK